jgi:eukaryotic-like serine/threonine-protein kinase
VHRDLKPSNVLLAQDGPRVIDFGISQGAEAGSLTRTGLVVGSPGFMSPEQAEGREVGPPSDIFSLGAILAFAATGKAPFGSGPTAALVYRPASLDNVPAGVRPLIERCLAKDPSQRPTARDVLAWTGAVRSTAGWIPEPVTRTFVQLPASADPSQTITSAKLSASSWPVPGQPGRHEHQRGRRRLGRPLAIASLVAGLLAASAAGAIALTASAHQSSGLHSGQAAAGRTTSPTTSAPTTSAPAASALHASQTAAAPSTSPAATSPAGMPPAAAPPASTSPAASPTASGIPSSAASPVPSVTGSAAASSAASPAPSGPPAPAAP